MSAVGLAGKRILVMRAGDQAKSTLALLREHGADPISVPMLEIHPPSDPEPFRAALADLDRYGVIVFTSANGVDRFFAKLDVEAGKPTATLAAIGPGTEAALAKVGRRADVVATEHRGEGLAKALLAYLGEARPRVLVARAEVARDVLPDALRAAGCEVDAVAVYRTTPPPRQLLDGVRTLLESDELDVVTFTSSSTVEHLCDGLEPRAQELLARSLVASISPVTTETAARRGIRVDVTADVHTLPGLVEALERHFSKQLTKSGV